MGVGVMNKKPYRTKRIKSPNHIRQIIADELNRLRGDESLDSIHRARAIAYLSSVALTAMRDGELEDRIIEIENRLKGEEN